MKKQIILSVLCVLGIIILRNAWVNDDAYIAFRTVYNFVNGYGLTFNINERVQSFTNPLWVFAMSAIFFFTRESYFTTIFLGLFVSLTTVYLILKEIGEEDYSRFALITIIVIGSKTFIDFSTSGLENPFEHLLFVIFFFSYIKSRAIGDLKFLTFIAALAAINRLDNVIFYFFPILYILLLNRNITAIKNILIGLLPLILWELFALIYYGFPFPNTYYAKLYTGIDSNDYLLQGYRYLINSINIDPLTPLTIFFSIAFVSFYSWSTKRFYLVPILAGLLVYLFYTAKVGGDFMTGRFISPPLIVATCLLASIPFARNLAYVLSLPLLALFFSNPLSPIYSNSDYRMKFKYDYDELVKNDGITDERAWWHPQTGLMKLSRNLYILQKEKELKEKVISVKAVTNFVDMEVGLGFDSYALGPNYYVFHHMGLSDALIARLPMSQYNKYDWKNSHYIKKMPVGYRETLMTGKNVMIDSNLSVYYQKLKVIASDNIFSGNRFSEIIKFNLGGYNHLVNKEYYASASTFYHAIELPGKGGELRYDGDALFRKSKSIDTKDSVYLSFGPYVNLYAGKRYVINFHLKYEGEQKGKNVSVIDIYSNSTQTSYLKQNIRSLDFINGGRYQSFEIEFTPGADIKEAEFRILNLGEGKLSFDYIELRPLDLPRFI